jgi:hypothetical protein
MAGKQRGSLDWFKVAEEWDEYRRRQRRIYSVLKKFGQAHRHCRVDVQRFDDLRQQLQDAALQSADTYHYETLEIVRQARAETDRVLIECASLRQEHLHLRQTLNSLRTQLAQIQAREDILVQAVKRYWYLTTQDLQRVRQNTTGDLIKWLRIELKKAS